MTRYKTDTKEPTPMIIVGKAWKGGGANKTQSVSAIITIPEIMQAHPSALSAKLVQHVWIDLMHLSFKRN